MFPMSVVCVTGWYRGREEVGGIKHLTVPTHASVARKMARSANIMNTSVVIHNILILNCTKNVHFTDASLMQ